MLQKHASSFFGIGQRGLFFVLVIATILTVHASSNAAPSSNRKAINLPDDNPQAPFSGAILSGNTLYISGRIGVDSKTGMAPADLDQKSNYFWTM